MAVHAKRWSYRREGAHWRTWNTRLEDIAQLRRLLTSWTPTGVALGRRNAVTGTLLKLETGLLKQPHRAWAQPRDGIEVRWRAT